MKLINLFFISIIISFISSCAKQEEDKLVTSESKNAAPSSHVKTYAIASGSSKCTYGGVQIEMGIDDNMNGVLDASEVDSTDYVCNGSPGTDATALNSLLSVENEPAGSNCEFGGKKYNYGIDDNKDDDLDSNEIDGSSYVCNGKPIVWKGSLGSQPSNPEVGWAYYNTTDGKSYLYDGSSWSMIAKDGTTVIDIGFVWKGTLSEAPSSPSNGWAYYDSSDNKSYIYANSTWNILTQDGSKGDQGDKGDKGDKGDTGATGTSPRIQYTVYCSAILQGTSLKYYYIVRQWSNNDLFATAGIYGASFEVSASTMYSEIQTGWDTAAVLLTYDLLGDYNWGWWEVSANRTTGVVTIKNYDTDATGGSNSWTQDSSDCTMNTVF